MIILVILYIIFMIVADDLCRMDVNKYLASFILSTGIWAMAFIVSPLADELGRLAIIGIAAASQITILEWIFIRKRP